MDVHRASGPRRRTLVRLGVLVVAVAGLLELGAFVAAPGRLRPGVLSEALRAASTAAADDADSGSGPTGADGATAADDGSGTDGTEVAGDGTADGADDTSAEGLAALGVTLGPGWRPEGLFVSGYDPLAAFEAGVGVADWPERLRPRTELVLDAEPFVERAVIGRSPAPCYQFHRTVRDVTVGLPDPAGAVIRADLLAWLEPPYFSGVVRSRLDPRCVARPRSEYGFAIEEVHRTPCVVPPGSSVTDVRCFVVGQWAYHLGARDTRWSAHLTYERSSGELLLGEDLHVGVEVDEWRAWLERTVCLLGGTCEGIEHRHGQLQPSADGLVVWFAPGEADDVTLGTRRLVVPWDVVASIARR